MRGIRRAFRVWAAVLIIAAAGGAVAAADGTPTGGAAVTRTAGRPTPAGPDAAAGVRRESAALPEEAPPARRGTAMRLTVALGGLALLAIVGMILVKSVSRP